MGGISKLGARGDIGTSYEGGAVAAITQVSVEKLRDVHESNTRVRVNRAATAISLALIAIAYLFTALGLPISQDIPVVDEAIYANSAFEFARTNSIAISEFSAPNAIVETLWGGLFAKLFGSTYGVLRMATLLFTVASVPFMYLLCRSVGAARNTAVLGAALYLFNPLSYNLTHIFHTDPYSVALLVMAGSLISMGFRLADRPPTKVLLWLGGSLIGIAYLSRPQNLLLAAAALIVWMRWSDLDRAWHEALALVSPSLVVIVGHWIWSQHAGEPYIRSFYRHELLGADLTTILRVGSQSAITGFIYIGLFALPLVPLIIPTHWKDFLLERRRTAIYLGTALITIAIGLTATGRGPFHGQAWISNGGLGAVDRSFLGHRPTASAAILAIITIALFSAFYLLALNIVKSTSSRELPFRFLLVSILLVMGSVFVSSIPFHGHVLDRYWLPAVPIAIAGVTALAVRSTRRQIHTAWFVVATIAVTSVIGSYNAFGVLRQAHEYAQHIVSSGIDPRSLDAGASWSATYFGLADEPERSMARSGPFWVRFYATDPQPEFAIALRPLEGFQVVERQEYRSFLRPGSDYLYLLRRNERLSFYARPAEF